VDGPDDLLDLRNTIEFARDSIPNGAPASHVSGGGKFRRDGRQSVPIELSQRQPVKTPSGVGPHVGYRSGSFGF